MTSTHSDLVFREYSVAGPTLPRPDAMSLRHAELLAAAVDGALVVIRYGQHVAGRHGCGVRWTGWLDHAAYGGLTPEQVAALLADRHGCGVRWTGWLDHAAYGGLAPDQVAALLANQWIAR